MQSPRKTATALAALLSRVTGATKQPCERHTALVQEEGCSWLTGSVTVALLVVTGRATAYRRHIYQSE